MIMYISVRSNSGKKIYQIHLEICLTWKAKMITKLIDWEPNLHPQIH